MSPDTDDVLDAQPDDGAAGDPDTQTAETASATDAADANASWAAWNQGIANDNATWAESYENAGDSDHAAEYAQIADDHQETADDYANTAQEDLSTDGSDVGT